MSTEATYPPMTERLPDGSRVKLLPHDEPRLSPAERAALLVSEFTQYARSLPISLAIPRLGIMAASAIEEAVVSECRDLALRLNEAQLELEKWRSGGVTEELLRRGDGCILVGRGCAIVREDDYKALRGEGGGE